ncbi:hypothetical protein GGR50DRAFT_698591 [Xylaria sp. CBS 124048]|nr:hypothetical protein GGR50DRAFT_698591 [Xylaria sp. CBS 124048]
MGLQDHIDGLLERYLHLLHEYTALREELTALQTGIYQNIARANFAAERGVRFGQDYYDERMQASRLLAISHPDQDDGAGEGVPCFTITNPTAEGSAADSQVPNPPSHHDEVGAEPTASNASSSSSQTDTDAQSKQDTAADKGTDAIPKKPRDPLRWFGFFAPMALRQAQTQGIQAIERVIPRLASVSAEMAGVEIEVRRARKKRAKAEAAASKLAQQGERKQEVVLGT